MNKTKCTILIGVSGSGKSTVINNKFKDEYVCSTDKYVENFAKERELNYSDAFDKIQEDNLFKDFTRLFYIDIETCIKNDVNFVIDRTNLTIGSRKALINTLNEFAEKYDKEIKINGLFFDIPKNVVKERLENRFKETGKSIPEDVIDNQFKVFEKPTSEEFEHLSKVDEEASKEGKRRR
jgi:predicted kinase